MKFRDLFKQQLEDYSPLTEKDISILQSDRSTLTGKPFIPGDKILYAIIPNRSSIRPKVADFQIVTLRECEIQYLSRKYLFEGYDETATSLPRFDWDS